MLEEGGANAMGLRGGEKVGYPLGVRRPHHQPHADVVEGEEWVGAGEVDEGVVEGGTLGGETLEVCPERAVRFCGGKKVQNQL